MSPCSPSPGKRGGRGVSWVLAMLVFAASFGVFYERAARVGYNTDEGQAIWPSQYFQFVFLEGKVGDPPWGPNYWTLTQTPVYRYIIGAGIWLGGQQFQARLLGAEQQGDGVDVLVRAGPDVLPGRFGLGRVVE